MRRSLLVLCLLVATAAYAQPTITQAEYFIGTDPGEGFGTAITVSSADDSVNLAWTIATGSLPPNIYRVMVRVRTNAGLWGRPTPQFLVISPGNEVVQLVTQYEWSVDNGSFTLVDVADASTVSINQAISTVGLAPGVLHRVNIRTTDNAGRTGPATDQFLAISGAAQIPRLVTQYEYTVDNAAPTVVDVADAAQVNLAQVIATGSLAAGQFHRVKFRVTDDLGRVSQFTDQFLTIAPPAQLSRNITQYEFWVDSDPPTLRDPADAPAISINEAIASNSIPVGLHYLNVRTTDSQGQTGAAHRVPFIVMSPYSPSQVRTLAAAEFWVNTDPGVGSGIAIHLPQDGVWDEGQEQADTVITGIPIGLHRVGFRFKDDLNRWSAADYDSLLVGPILVIRPAAGNSVILDWQSGPGVNQFKIYRALTSNGTYALIDSTAGHTYTDVGITGSQLKSFYQVRFETNGFSPFRMPDAVPARE